MSQEVCADHAARDEVPKLKKMRVAHLKQITVAVSGATSNLSLGVGRLVMFLAEVLDEMEELEKRIAVLEEQNKRVP